MAISASAQPGVTAPQNLHYKNLHEQWNWVIPIQFLPEIQEILADVPERLVYLRIEDEVIFICHNFSPRDFRRKVFGVRAYHECHQKYASLQRIRNGKWVRRKEKPVPFSKQLHVWGYDSGYMVNGVFVKI